MNGTVIIRKGKILIRMWNPQTRKYDERRKRTQALSDVLSWPIEIEQTTFGQFFELIAREAKFFQHAFSSWMGHYPIQAYIDECRKPPKKDENQMDHVEVHWHPELFKGEFSIEPSFGGWGWWSGKHMDGRGRVKGGWAIEFTALNKYARLPLKLKTEVEVCDMEKWKKKLLKAKRRFTVHDVIQAILYEITWGGNPKDRDCQMNDIKKSADEAMKQCKAKEGKHG